MTAGAAIDWHHDLVRVPQPLPRLFYLCSYNCDLPLVPQEYSPIASLMAILILVLQKLPTASFWGRKQLENRKGKDGIGEVETFVPTFCLETLKLSMVVSSIWKQLECQLKKNFFFKEKKNTFLSISDWSSCPLDKHFWREVGGSKTFSHWSLQASHTHIGNERDQRERGIKVDSTY